MPFDTLARQDTLIADEMGLGKTIQGLGVVNAMAAGAGRALRVLVVGPKIALRNWRREAGKWLVVPHASAIWTSAKQPSADLVIVNYDILAKPAVAAGIRAVKWDLAIYDEAHVLKNGKAARTKAVLGGGRGDERVEPIRAGRRLFLTGTPILNRPIELYSILHSMGVSEAVNWNSEVVPPGWTV